MDIDAMLAAAKLPEDTVALCLRPDLRKRWEDLDAELVREKDKQTTLAPTSRQRGLAQEIKGLEAEIAEHTLQVRMRGLAHAPWVELVAAHPPRNDKPAEQVVGMNMDTFVPALIRAEMVEPELSDEQYEQLIDVITDAQYDNLANTAWALGRAERNAPVFSQAASLVIPDSSETSRQQPGSGYPRRGTRAKNPAS